MFNYHRKKIASDFIYSIVASVILTGVMQLLVYPFLSRRLTQDEYGSVITLMGIINTICGSFGTALNNTRIIQNNKYSERGLLGDYNILHIVALAISFISIFLISSLYFSYSIKDSLLISVVAILVLSRQYITAEYRIKLNFRHTMLSNVCGAAGYAIAVLAFHGNWILIFLIAEVASMAYVLLTTKLWRDPICITPLCKETTLKVTILLFSVLFSNALTYFDRIFLHPVLGAEAVSSYSVASFVGKSLAIVMTPISSVLLGYFAKKGFVMGIKQYRKFNLCIVGISGGFAIAVFVVAPFITRLLYPSIYPSTTDIIFLANLAAIVSVSCNMIQTVILKYSPTYFQFIKEIAYLSIYILICILLIPRNGLMGFCIATLVANTLKYLIMLIMGEITFKNSINRLAHQ